MKEKGNYWVKDDGTGEEHVAFWDGQYFWIMGGRYSQFQTHIISPMITKESCIKPHSVKDCMGIAYSQMAMDAYHNVPFGSGMLAEAAREIPEVGDRWKVMDTIKKYYL